MKENFVTGMKTHRKNAWRLKWNNNIPEYGISKMELIIITEQEAPNCIYIYISSGLFVILFGGCRWRSFQLWCLSVAFANIPRLKYWFDYSWSVLNNRATYFSHYRCERELDRDRESVRVCIWSLDLVLLRNFILVYQPSHADPTSNVRNIVPCIFSVRHKMICEHDELENTS